MKQQRLLLFLRHCSKCKDENCTQVPSCKTGKELWHHLVRCGDHKCKYPRCVHSRELLRHYQKCSKEDCPICVPVRKYVDEVNNHKNAHQMSRRHQMAQNGLQQGGMPVMHPGGGAGSNGMHGAPGMMMMPNQMQSGMMMNGMGSMGSMPMGSSMGSGMHGGMGSMQMAPAMHPHSGGMRMHGGVKRELDHMAGGFGYGNHMMGGSGDMKRMGSLAQPEKIMSMADIKVHPLSPACLLARRDTLGQAGVAPHVQECLTERAAVQKNLGASLIETFSVEQIDTHLRTCGEEMAKAPVKGLPPLPPGEEPCPVCKAQHVLRFEPPPLCCVTCLTRIKRNATFYRSIKPDAVWCQSCFQGAGEDLQIENMTVKKADVQKLKHEQHEDEAWVGCDNPACGKWVHMICGLFNKVRPLL